MAQHGVGEPARPAATRGGSCARACATAAPWASPGFQDWTIDGIHLCTTRLNLLQLNTMRALDPERLADVEALREPRRRGAARPRPAALPHAPAARRAGFHADQLGRGARAGRRSRVRRRARSDAGDGGDRLGFFLTARGITNEVYYVAQKVARFLGTNSVDNAARICHAPSTERAQGRHRAWPRPPVATPTSSSRTSSSSSARTSPNAQPVFMKYLYMARKRGARIAVVNPMREPGLERYWVPVEPRERALRHADGDRLLPGPYRRRHRVPDRRAQGPRRRRRLMDDRFISEHTTGWAELRASLADRVARGPRPLGRLDGRGHRRRFAQMYADAGTAVLVWSMGITQHVCGSGQRAGDHRPRRWRAATSGGRVPA